MAGYVQCLLAVVHQHMAVQLCLISDGADYVLQPMHSQRCLLDCPLCIHLHNLFRIDCMILL